MWLAAQATVGTLVAKTLTTTSQNPYQGGRAAASSAAPAALDAFSIQVPTSPPASASATAHAVRHHGLSRCGAGGRLSGNHEYSIASMCNPPRLCVPGWAQQPCFVLSEHCAPCLAC